MKVWVFGDEVSTDVIAPGRYLAESGEELTRHILESIAPSFAREVSPGDVIIAGRNFGCGSSREQAASGLRQLGIGAVFAESFGRIFFRTAISIGLPAMMCLGITRHFATGDGIAYSVREATAQNMRTGEGVCLHPLPPFMLDVVLRGGILAVLKEKYSSTRER